MEVLVAGELKYEALFPAITASFAASMTSKALGLTKFTFAISYDFSLSGMFLIKLVLLGVIFGFVGGAICMELKKSKTADVKQNTGSNCTHRFDWHCFKLFFPFIVWAAAIQDWEPI